jgi:alanine racemase
MITNAHYHPNWLEIDLDALDRNVRTIRHRLKKGTRLMAVVKADAYGLGAVEVGRTVLKAGTDWLAVYDLSEAKELRAAGIDAPILTLFSRETDADDIVNLSLSPSVHELKLVRALSESAARQNTEVKVHVKIDTGLGRMGVNWKDALGFIKKVSEVPNIRLGGVFSTPAEAGAHYTRKQFVRFLEVLSGLEKAGIAVPLRHFLTSSSLANSDMELDMVRVGLLLYGCVTEDTAIPLEPVLAYKARVENEREIGAGGGIGYGMIWKAKRKSRVVIISSGYSDGLWRNLSNRGIVLIDGNNAPIVGRVSINHCYVDVTGIPSARVGDDVVFIGKSGARQITMEEFAKVVGTTSYEVLCKMSGSIPRLYIKGGRIISQRWIKPVYEKVNP